LEIERVQKDINMAAAAGGFYTTDTSDNITKVCGICIGPQDTFFTNGTNTVNVSFVENEVNYISYVYDDVLQLLFIYINGVITGVIRSTADATDGFTINSDNFVFRSDSCDIDLYKVRVYDAALSVNEIVTNYAVDTKNVVTYDQNKLAIENTALQEY
jgi:hypothetical protein